jgi:hypothetical protein
MAELRSIGGRLDSTIRSRPTLVKRGGRDPRTLLDVVTIAHGVEISPRREVGFPFARARRSRDDAKFVKGWERRAESGRGRSALAIIRIDP